MKKIGIRITVTCPMCNQNMHIQDMGFYACENCDWELWQMEDSVKDKPRYLSKKFIAAARQDGSAVLDYIAKIEAVIEAARPIEDILMSTDEPSGEVLNLSHALAVLDGRNIT